MSHAQRPPPPVPDRRLALAYLWKMADYMKDDFFVPTFENGKESPLAWTFQNLPQLLKKQTTSAHSRPPSIIYRIYLGDATPGVEYLLVYVHNPKDRSNLQANKDAFKRGLAELANDSQRSMSEMDAD